MLLVFTFVISFAGNAVAYELHNGPTGVLYYEKDKCFNGYTLFTPTENNNVTYLMDMEGNVVHTWEVKNPENIAVRLRVKKKVQNLNAMWYKEFAKNFATQGDFGLESP